jgi:hypothetical protein
LTVGKFARYPGSYELRHTTRGHPFYVWKKPVPRIDDNILDGVIYLYRSVEDAEEGLQFGGSGFLVGVPSVVHEGFITLYAVTNSHVIRGNYPIIRLNTKRGDTDVIPLSTDAWVHHEDGDDLAACPLAIAPGEYKYSHVPPSMFLTREVMAEHNIGPGDEIFMAGRFVSHQGEQRNTPLVRFGNISMMPTHIRNEERGMEQESFLVEVHSLSGFSGSPVYVDIPPLSPRPGERPGVTDIVSEAIGPWLLGVDWGHFRIRETVKEQQGEKWEDVPEGYAVEVNTGQAMVVPAWRLQQLLDQEELVMARKRGDDEVSKRKASSPVALDVRPHTTEQADRPAQEFDTFTKGDFEDAIDRVSRPAPPPDSER